MVYTHNKPKKNEKMTWPQSGNPWLEVVVPGILRIPAHHDVVLSKEGLPPPKEAGARKSIGEPDGQIADFRITLSDGKSVHIKEYDFVFKVHWDWFDPVVDWINHLRHDAPHWWILLTTVVGGAIGYVWHRNPEGIVTGAFSGLTFGVATCNILDGEERGW